MFHCLSFCCTFKKYLVSRIHFYMKNWSYYFIEWGGEGNKLTDQCKIIEFSLSPKCFLNKIQNLNYHQFVKHWNIVHRNFRSCLLRASDLDSKFQNVLQNNFQSRWSYMGENLNLLHPPPRVTHYKPANKWSAGLPCLPTHHMRPPCWNVHVGTLELPPPWSHTKSWCHPYSLSLCI